MIIIKIKKNKNKKVLNLLKINKFNRIQIIYKFTNLVLILDKEGVIYH